MAQEHKLSFHKPLLMGILNVTPDSFSGDGKLLSNDYVEASFRQAQAMISDGADIIDIGGESTRPGSVGVSAQEEIDRIAPVVERIRQELGPDVVLSIDTMKAATARAAVQSGCSIINDVSGHKAEPAIYELAAAENVYLVLMHNRSSTDAVVSDPRLGCAYGAPLYTDIMSEVLGDLGNMIKRANAAGVPRDNMILDPGLGFGKTVQQNLFLLNHMDELTAFGLPVLSGPSRKSFLGHILNAEAADRIEGTSVAVTISLMRGARIIRVHDVKQMARVMKMTQACLCANDTATAC